VNQVRATAGGLTFEELFRSRDVFEADVEETLKEKMTEFGYIIVNILVDDPQPSSDLRDAFDRVIASKRLREAAENEGEAARVLAVAKASAEGESLRIKGEAYAHFRKTIAEGNAEALNKIAGETGLTAKDGLAFFNSINEMEAIRDAAANGGKVVFVAGSAKNDSESALLGMVSAGGDDTPAGKTTSEGKATSKAKATSEKS
jgi:regulator of protease activity HflC (stomatin/prohibitin superfamily)